MAKRKYVKENNLVKAINTDSLELQKPLVNEYYDINVHNSNMDKIDAGYRQNKNDISNINYELSKTENTKYSTENGVKEFNCKDGYVDNVVIEGKTLVNLTSHDKGIRALTEASGNIWSTSTNYGNFSELEGVITYNTGSERWSDFGSIIPVTEGSKIRFIVNMISNPELIDIGAMFFSAKPEIGVSGANTEKIINFTKIGGADTLGICDNQFSVPKGATYALFFISCSSANSTYVFDNFMLLENNEDDFISYFEGLKSVGQGDKIEVVSCTDNIYSDTNKTVGKILAGEGVLIDYPTHDCSDYIVIEPNSIYYTNIPHGFVVYDANKNIIDNKAVVGMSSVNGKYIMPNNAKYLRINLDKDTSNYLITKKYDKKQISTTLRSLPNGVKDTIEKRGNRYVKVQRCKEIVLDGSLELSDTGVSNQVNTRGQNIIISDMKKDINSLVMCDNFKSIIKNDKNEAIDEEYLINMGDGRLRIRVLGSKLSASNMEAVKSYLNSTKPTIVYELATSIITELPNFNPQTYEGDTTLLLNTGVIQGECEFEVTNSMGSEIEVLKDKVGSLDVEVQKAFQYGDNVKTQLVDKLISEGLYVSTNNTFEELISGIALGKKWASGTNSIDTSKYNFGTRFGGSSLKGYFYNLTVSGLSFKPSFIIAYVKSSNTNYPYLFTVMSNVDDKPAFSIYGTYYNSEYNGYNYMLTTDTNYHISNGSFNIPIMRYGDSIDYNNCYWVAYE